MGECTALTAAAAAVKTSVWWDIDRCAVPPGGCDPHRIAHNVITALAAEGCTGPVSISAYGDAARIAPAVLAALSSTGISLNHVPAGAKDGIDKKMLVDMMFWAIDNPPPGNYFLISGDRDFSDLLHRLRMKRYCILLAQPSNASSVALAAAAKTVWTWESLADGEPLLAESTHTRRVPGCNRNSSNSDALRCSQGKVRAVCSTGDSYVKTGKSLLLVESTHTRDVPDCNQNSNNAGVLKCSESKVSAVCSKDDSYMKTWNQYTVKPLQKYVKKTSAEYGSASNKDQVQSVDGSAGNEIDRTSVSSSSSSKSMDADHSGLLGIRTVATVLAQESVVSACSQQAELSNKFILDEKFHTPAECVLVNGTLDFSVSNGHYHQTYQQSQSSEAHNKFHSDYNTGDNIVKVDNKYVKKTNTTSSSAGNRHDSVGVHGCSMGSTTSKVDQFSVLSSSSESLEGAKVHHPSLLGTCTLSQPSAQKPVVSSHLHQVRAPHKLILGKNHSTTRDRSSVLPSSDSESLEGAKVDCSSLPGISTLSQPSAQQPEVSTHLHQFRARSELIHGMNHSITSKLDRSSVSPSSSESLEGGKMDCSSMPGISALSQPSAQKPVGSTRLHQVRAPHLLILGKKHTTSTQHSSGGETNDVGVSIDHYHSTHQQCSPSQAQYMVHSNYNMDDNKGDKTNQHNVTQHQEYVNKTNTISSSASNAIDLVDGFPGKSRRRISSHPRKSMSSSSSSKPLEGRKVKRSTPPKSPPLSLSSVQKSVMSTPLHHVGAEFVFGENSGTSTESTPKNGIFHFGGSKDSINSDTGSSFQPSAGLCGVSLAQIQTSVPSGPAFQSLPDICPDISRLTISDTPEGTGETRPPFLGTPATYPFSSMPSNAGHPRGLHETSSNFHPGSNSFHPSHSSAVQSVQPPSGDYTCRLPHPPNVSFNMQNHGMHAEIQGSPPNSSGQESPIRNILHALRVLRMEKIFPTETNIADCIHYGEMSLSGFDVKKALELAIRHQAVTMKKLVNDMPLFVAKDEIIWKCVNVTNSKAKRPKETLDAVHKYISCTDGYSAIKNSQSRYQAATILKKFCLQRHALGDVLQILHIVIVREKWLVPHPSGWQPLSLNTIVIDATADSNCRS